MRLETDAANNAAPPKRGVRRLTVSTSRVLWTFALSSGALLTCPAPLSSQSLIGRTTAELSAGDYVLPRFSPSGRFLVVSQVLADTATENTQILLRSEEHTSELQSRLHLVCRLLLEKKKNKLYSDNVPYRD